MDYEDLEEQFQKTSIQEIENDPNLMVFGFCRQIRRFAKELAVTYPEKNKISVTSKLNIIREYCRMIEEK